MSLRDHASLSPQERAALAGLEARASAEDPAWAAQMAAGHTRSAALAFAKSQYLSRLWVGPVLAVVGLALAVLGLSISAIVSIAGALILCAGLGSCCSSISRKVTARDDSDAEAGAA